MEAKKEPLNPELDKYLGRILERIQEIKDISVIDREGVVLGRACVKDFADRNGSFSSVLATAADQASKCGMGNCKSLVSFYNDHVLVCINHSPITVTFIGTLEANVGLILDTQDELRIALEPLHTIVNIIEEQHCQ